MTLTAIASDGSIVDGRTLDDPRRYREFDQLRSPISGAVVFPVRAYTRSDRSGVTSAHFRHQQKVTDIQWPAGLEPDSEYGRDGFLVAESAAHLEAKRFIAEQLEAEVKDIPGAQVLLEHRVAVGNGRWRIADVALLIDGQLREVHEAQISLLNPDTITARTDDYASLKAATYWWLAGTAADSAEIRAALRERCGGFYELEPEASSDELREPSRPQPATPAPTRSKGKARG